MRLAISGFLIVSAFVALAPVLWVVGLSLRTGADVYSRSVVPRSLRLENFGDAWAQFGLGPLFLNSILVTGLSVLVAVTLSVAQPELSDRIIAPAFDAAVLEQRAGVVRAGVDRDRGRANVHEGKILAHLARFVADQILGQAEPACPVVVGAPALDGAVLEQRAHLVAARHGDHAGCSKVRRRKRVA